MNKEYNYKSINMINGELIEAKDHFENLINFSKRWKDRMNKIKDTSLSRD